MPTFKIKSKILIPLVLTIIFLLAVFIYGVYWMQDRNIKDHANNTFDSIESLLDSTLNTNACLMGALLDTLMRDRFLNEALQKKDGSLLLKLAGPLFEDLHLEHEITHLYFSDPNRVNLLRVHKPSMHGDVINRLTTLKAEKTGKLSHGVEMGPLGTFTLRVVAPWYEEKRLIGFVEIGKEIDIIIKMLSKTFKLDFFIIIEKKNLNREDWENGMRMLHREPEWEKIKSWVLVDKTIDKFPDYLISLLNKGTNASELTNIELLLNGRLYRSKFLSLKDINNQTIGNLVVINPATKYLTI